MKRQLLLAFGCFLFLLACSSSRVKQLPKDYLEFGQLNQRSGATKRFILTEEGKLYKLGLGADSLKKCRSLPWTKFTMIYNLVAEMKQRGTSLYRLSDNMSYIRIVNPAGTGQEWKWPVSDKNLPLDLKKLADLLNEIQSKQR